MIRRWFSVFLLTVQLALLGWLGSSCPVEAVGPIVIDREHRVSNAASRGVCWWACAETVGRHLGWAQLHGLRDRVLLTGFSPEGATEGEITQFLRETGVRARSCRSKDLKFLTSCLADGLPVVVVVQDWRDMRSAHALVLTGITDAKVENWLDGKGRPFTDYIVTLIDPNDHLKTLQYPLGHFMKIWTGHATALEKPSFEESRRILVSPADSPVYPFQFTKAATLLPVKNEYPEPDKQPSNQDIKDGINRPDDLLRIPVVRFRPPYQPGTRP